MTLKGNTPYDDAWHIMGIRAARLFLYPINHIFKTNYPLDTPIVARPNETLFNGKRIITDMCFQVGTSDTFELFILEEQAWSDGAMAQRLLEYIFSHAAMLSNDVIQAGRVSIPRAAVINLRGRQKSVSLPIYVNGKQVDNLTLGVINLQDYRSQDDLAKDNLYCLLPYGQLAHFSDAANVRNEMEQILQKAVSASKLEVGESALIKAVWQGVDIAVQQKKQSLGEEVTTMYDLEKLIDDILDRDRRNREEGEAQGITKGESRLGRLISMLLGNGRNQDISDAATNPTRRMELYREFGIV